MGYVAVVLAAMGWLSVKAVELDRARAAARAQAAREEAIRLALWRVDSTLAPIVAAGSAHPYFAFGSFYPAERAYTRMLGKIQHGEVLMPTVMQALAEDDPFGSARLRPPLWAEHA